MASAHSEAAKMEQIITEFFAKTLQIILESRSAYVSSRNFSGDQALSSLSSTSSSSPSVRPRDKWFNLALRECPAALENSDLLCRNNHEPMVVDVILVQRPVDFGPASFSPKERNLDREEFYGCETRNEKVIERWVVQHESGKSRDTCNHGNKRLSNSILYKKTTLLLRSLYVTVRLLPAYKIYHDLNSSSRIIPCALAHCVSSFVEPFTRREEAEMQRFVFTPVDTSTGRLCLSVLYHSSLSDIISSESSTPLSPQVITDYVGSPLADPLKRFPSLPVAGSALQGCPSSTPFTRRHSWGFDIHSTSSPLPHPLEKSSVEKKDSNLDEYCPSLIFALSPSPSTSPSPPIRIPGSHLPNSLLRSESAPVRIPAPKLANNSSAIFKQNLPPSSPLKSTGVTRAGTLNNKLLCPRKEDTKHGSGLKLSSNSSPRVSFSRSSSQSMPHDFDESDCACPFDVDEDDVTDPGSRPESFEQRGGLCNPVDPGGLFSTTRKSQDAAVGELVLMLRKAQPLHQEFSNSVVANSSVALRPGITIPEPNQAAKHGNVMGSGSGLVMPKTTADALEELQGYRDLKNLLLARGSKSHI